ncbi:hypothetical protein LINPERPRIM_LOCUS9790 [Linum perenne]
MGVGVVDAADWRFWKIYLRPASTKSVTIHMVERVAGKTPLFEIRRMETEEEDGTVETSSVAPFL